MLVLFLFTLVQSTPTGMFVANGGETHDLPDDFALSLIEKGKAEAAYPSDLADIAAPVLGDDGEPLNPPEGDSAADIAAPATIDDAPIAKRGSKTAAADIAAPDSPIDAPLA